MNRAVLFLLLACGLAAAFEPFCDMVICHRGKCEYRNCDSAVASPTSRGIIPIIPYSWWNVCTSSTDCSKRETCVKGKCVKEQVRSFFPLRSLITCPYGTIKMNGKCIRYPSSFVRCTNHLQCPENRPNCVNGDCVERCTDSVECPDNRQCINGSCLVIE